MLLDEPELHLNPALLRAMPDFYHRHLGRAMDNQIWLVTHSDALLRAAVGHPRFSVFHMTQSSDFEPTANQARAVLGDDELELATMALVGDLSTYKPLAKLVVVEGGGASEFDRTVVERLFPAFARRVNLVSGGSKAEVHMLYRALENVGKQLGVEENRFVAVVDADSAELDVLPKPARVLRWDVYHVENYLLVDELILEVANAVGGKQIFEDVSNVDAALRECASTVIDDLVMHRLRAEVNDALVAVIDLGGSPKSTPAEALRGSIDGSVARFNATAESFAPTELAAREQQLRTAFENDLASERWRETFPARSILTQFVHEHVPNIQYEAFRNLILDRMALGRQEPPGMRAVIDKIIHADGGDVGSG